MAETLVKIDRIESIAVVQLQNGKVNPLSIALLEQLHTSLQSLGSDPTLGCIIIKGSDKAFSG